jgi:hypothetical protein
LIIVPRIELERIETAEDIAQSSTESFDRVAFTERALALLRLPKTTVAILEGTRRVHVAAGRQWGAEEGARWAMISVPRNASRLAIANAVLALLPPKDARETGGSGGVRRWALDVLVASCEDSL